MRALSCTRYRYSYTYLTCCLSPLRHYCAVQYPYEYSSQHPSHDVNPHFICSPAH